MSKSPLSLAKTTPPGLSNAVSRERLLARIDNANGPVVWISGPPGAGKTTLAASYLDWRDCPHLWYQVDGADRDVATFFLYVGKAAAAVAPGRAKRLPLLSPGYASDLETFARRYFRTLYACLGTPFVIVLDNFPDVTAPTLLSDVLRTALEELPEAVRVLITSRMEPPRAMARLRANQVVFTIDADALRLNRDELHEMATMRGLTLSEEARESLYHKTQGWAAGAVLMLEHYRTDARLRGVPATTTPQVIFDYLAGEIFDNFDATTRNFLLGASFMPRMTAEAARALTGESEAAALLSELARGDYFVVESRRSSGNEYQFHPLFREFLQNRAESCFPAPALSRWRGKAARLLCAAGALSEAVELLADDSDWDAIADIITEHADPMLGQGRGQTLAEWLDALPDSVMMTRPWLLYWSGAARYHGSPRHSRRCYERAFARFQAQAERSAQHEGLVLSCCGVIDTILYEFDDLSLLDPWIETLAGLLENTPDALSESMEARVTCAMFMSLVLRQPDHPHIVHWAQRATVFCEGGTKPDIRMVIEPWLALSFMWTGQYRKASDTIERLRLAAAQADVPPFALVTFQVMESMYHMLRGERRECLESVNGGLRICQMRDVRVWGNQLMANAVGAELGAGNLEAAAQWLEKMEAAGGAGRRLDACLLHYFRAWHALLGDDVLTAYREQKRALGFAVELGMPFCEVLYRLGLAQILFACGDEVKGQVELRKVHHMARDINNRLLEFMSLLVYAHIAITQGKKRSGLNSLRYALALGREHGYTHCLWWQPGMIAELCRIALAENIEVEFVRSLVRTRDLFPAHPPFDVASWPWKFRIRTLGAFSVVIDDVEQRFPGKSPGRPLELLKILIALGGKDVRAENLGETMWSHVDGDYAHRSFTTTLHRLRKLLGNDEAVLLRDGRVSLNERCVWVDVWALEHVFSQLDSAFRDRGAEPDRDTAQRLGDRVLDTYTGAFLRDESDQPCYIAAREHWRSKRLRHVSKLARYWEEAGEADMAIECYERALESDNLSEGFYRRLMLCHEALGHHGEVIEVYERCRAAFSGALQAAPSVQTTELYERLVGET